jgi:hypothetical protein
MNLTHVDQIAKAVLYEGYMLYPYRPSSVKNRQRWNFGVVYPQSYQLEGAEISRMKTQCVVCGDANTRLDGMLRFLHLQTRVSTPGDARSPMGGWQEAEERDVALPEITLGELTGRPLSHEFSFPAETHHRDESDTRKNAPARAELLQEAVDGTVDISAEEVRDGVFKVSVVVQNITSSKISPNDRYSALLSALVSTHIVLGVKNGEFVSLLEPSEGLQEIVAQCQNVGAFPVLVGNPGDRDTMLASPIILYDYPQIAPESAGDLFDGTEIDEILSLRILTLTDDEKQEIRQSDGRARQMLERTEAMSAEQFMKLHGVVRGLRPLKEDRP